MFSTECANYIRQIPFFFSKSFAMGSHSFADEGGCKHIFQRTMCIASRVSDIDSVDFTLRYENDKDCVDLPVARIVE